MEPRISVLMAIYNCADTLEEALESLINQTYQGFKVILCDDCSTDNTYEVAKNYITKYPDKFILLKNEKNMKLPATLNRCLEHTDTEYVARMDGDDWSKPERLKKEIDFLDSHSEYALVSCAMDYFDGKNIFMTSNPVFEPSKNNFIGGTPHAHAPVLIRTLTLKEVGGYTVKRWTQRGQDTHLWAKIYNKGYKGANLSEALYIMRDDTNASKRRKPIDALYSFKRVYEIYKLMNISLWYMYDPLFSLFKALLPTKIYEYFHRKCFKK